MTPNLDMDEDFARWRAQRAKIVEAFLQLAWTIAPNRKTRKTAAVCSGCNALRDQPKVDHSPDCPAETLRKALKLTLPEIR